MAQQHRRRRRLSTDLRWPAGYGRVILDEVDSTLDEAARISGQVAQPTWILAHRQTAARGRRGRPWQNPPGNFSATLVLHPAGPADQVALRSFVAALALYDTCAMATGRGECFSLKWPNDVLLNGGKLAGILLESAGQGRGVQRLFIGIGVNLAAAPEMAEVEPGAVRPVSLLSETGARVTPDEFLDLLAASYAAWEDRFTTYGFAPVREAWLRHAARLGEVITARSGTSETQGTFETVDDAGNLVLNTAKGRMAISAADVFF